MSAPATSRDIALPDGGLARLSGDRLLVFEAVEVCLRRARDATMYEVFEVISAQLGYTVQANAYSGRFSELCDIGVLELSPERRDDVKTMRLRAKRGFATRVKAWRLPVMQKRLVA